MIVESLQLLLGFEFDKEELKQFDESIQTINKSMVALGATVIAGASAITAMTLSSSRSSVDMLKLSSATGTAVENLEALEYVSAQNSIASNTLSGALESVRNNIAGISKGGGSAIEAFSLLDISVFNADGTLRDSYETMKEATEKLSKMTDATRQADYAQQIFGGSASEMMFMLRKGSQAFTEGEMAMKRYGSALTRDQLENVSKFSQTWDVLTNSFSQFADLVWSQLSPAMNDLVSSFLEWWAINREIITANVIKYYKAFAGVIIMMVKWFWELVKVVAKVVDSLGGLQHVLKILLWTFGAIMAIKFVAFLVTMVSMVGQLTKAILKLNLASAMMPLAIAGIILVLALIFDEIKGFIENRASVIEELVGKEWADAFRKGLSSIGFIFEKDGFTGVFKALALALYDAFEEVADKIDTLFLNMFNKIIESFKNLINKEIVEPMTNALNKITGSHAYKNTEEAIEKTQEYFNPFKNSNQRLESARSKGYVSNQSNTNANVINVNTQSQAVALAIINDANQSEYNNANNQYS